MLQESNMASGRKRVSFSLDVTFGSPEERDMFLNCLKRAKECLTLRGSSALVDNFSLVTSAIDSQAEDRATLQDDTATDKLPKSFLHDGVKNKPVLFCSQLHMRLARCVHW